MIKDLLQTLGVVAVLFALWVIIPVLLVVLIFSVTAAVVYLVISEYNQEQRSIAEDRDRYL